MVNSKSGIFEAIHKKNVLSLQFTASAGLGD